MPHATTTYGYDEADQLTSATTGGVTTDYAYDAAGNQTQDGGTTYAYDAQDQVTSSTAAAGTTDYGYTLSGALASVTPPGGTAEGYTSDAYGDQITAPGGIGYAYDALGRLVTRTVGSGSASLSYLGTGDTLAYDGTSDYSYTPSGGLTAEQASGGTAYATMSDLHGDVAGRLQPLVHLPAWADPRPTAPYGTPTIERLLVGPRLPGRLRRPDHRPGRDGRPLVQPLHRLLHQQRHHLRQPSIHHRRRQPLRLHQRQPPHRDRPHRAP